MFDVDGDDVARNKAAQQAKRNSTGSGSRSDPLDLFEFLDQAEKNSTLTADSPYNLGHLLFLEVRRAQFSRELEDGGQRKRPRL